MPQPNFFMLIKNKIKCFFFLLVLLQISGCSSSNKKWYSNNYNTNEIRQILYKCKHDAQLATSGNVLSGVNARWALIGAIVSSYEESSLFDECVEAYNLSPEPLITLAEEQNLTKTHSKTDCFNTIVDKKKSFIDCVTYAEKGDESAQYNLGWMYQNGQGVTQDFKEALNWYEKSAEQGNQHAQHNLGFMYSNGLGVTQNHIEALNWYRKSAEQGNQHAQNNLGWMFSNVQGVTQDFKEALKWYEKSAEQGNQHAQNNLGWMYSNGLGVTQNYIEALNWYRKSAEQGNHDALYSLGWMYSNGLGVAQDYVMSHMYMNIASANGNKEAGEFRNILTEKMTSSQIESAQKLAQEWMKKINK